MSYIPPPVTRPSSFQRSGIATGAPLGPFQIYDIIGLTTPYNILSHGNTHTQQLAAWLKEHYIDHGKLGVASGEGFYRYDKTPN